MNPIGTWFLGDMIIIINIMEKKFRLIKEYPGFLGCLGKETSNRRPDGSFTFNFGQDNGIDCYQEEYFLSVPGFWEEVK
jgi:hypothetical protein